MATPKEAAILVMTEKIENNAFDRGDSLQVQALIQRRDPQYRITPARMDKINAEYEKAILRFRKGYATYMKGRGYEHWDS